MESEHEIIYKVMLAKQSSKAADDLVRQYMPFIKKEVSKLSSTNTNDYDDRLSIAMFAFHEAVLSYNKNKGTFLTFASVVIKNRLIDFQRKENRHAEVVLTYARNDEEDEQNILETYIAAEDNVAQKQNYIAAKEEIAEFTRALNEFGLDLSDVSDNCPRQHRTFKACVSVLNFAKDNPEILVMLTETKKLPVAMICKGTSVERKLIERHRKYLVAILLAYTNGFEIIRGHLKQLSHKEGGSE